LGRTMRSLIIVNEVAALSLGVVSGVEENVVSH
jgi:hypothetical protein